MPAVMQMRPVWRCAQIAAHRSSQARIWPPKTLPSALACVGSTYSVIVASDSATRLEVGEGAPMRARLVESGSAALFVGSTPGTGFEEFCDDSRSDDPARRPARRARDRCHRSRAFAAGCAYH